MNKDSAKNRVQLEKLLTAINDPGLRLNSFQDLVGKKIAWVGTPFREEDEGPSKIIVTECMNWLLVVLDIEYNPTTGRSEAYTHHGYDMDHLSGLISPDQLVSAGFIHEIQKKYFTSSNH